MFFQSPDEQANCSKITSKTLKSKARSRKQKKLRRKNRLKAIRKRQNQIRSEKAQLPVLTVPITAPITIPSTMTTWAEDFTRAATWQLKNEVAYWKSKAKALEQENKILHWTIRQNINDAKPDEKKRHEVFQYDSYLADLNDSEDEQDEESDQDDEEENAEPESVASEQDQFEVSEEYIQFLRDNQVYRDFARQERERIKAENDIEKTEIEEMEAGPAEHAEDEQEILKKLYGDAWERISALEMSLRTQFISICDEGKPMYWPNIPFNFNFG